MPSWLQSLQSRLEQWQRRRRPGEESDEAFVERTYQELLGRPVDAVGRTWGLQALQQGPKSRDRLRAEIMASAEYQSYQSLCNLYRELLDRSPVWHERDAIRLLQEGKMDLDDLRRTIIDSMEYTFRQVPVPPDEEPYRAADLPTQITLELTTRCNMIPPCVMCERLVADPTSRWCDWEMDPQIWQRLLPVLRQTKWVEPFGSGEPLVYTHFFDLLAQLDPEHSIIGLNTNGILLTEANSRRIIENGVSWISISVDAATPQTYMHIRRRRDLEKLLGKIRRLVQLKTELGRSRPRVEINMTLMCHNLPEAPAFVELGAQMGVDQVMFQQLRPGKDWKVEVDDSYRFDYAGEELHNCAPLHNEMMEQAWTRSQALGIPLKYDIVYQGAGIHWPQERTTWQEPAPESVPAGPQEIPAPTRLPCTEPWTHLLVSVNGNTSFCCYQVEKLILGNVMEDSFAQVWNGPRARTVRALFLQGQVPSCCRGCYRLSGIE